MKKKIIKKIFLLLLLWLLNILVVNIYVLHFSKDSISKNVSDIKNYEIWLVFWAKVKDSGIPSDILADRLKVWAEAYSSWKIKQIIVSWDNSRTDYDEVTAMADYLVELWVKKEDIYLDYAGFDTYDTLYRAKEIFGVEKVVLFTQEFHLKRAIYIWKRLWLDVFWVSTNLQKYIYDNYYNRREILARIKAFLNVEIIKSQPTYLWNKVDMSKPQEEISELKV